MAIQSKSANTALNQTPEHTVNVAANQPTAIVRTVLIITGSIVLITLLVITIASGGAISSLFEPPAYLLPGSVVPDGLKCGEFANLSCYPPIDAHCYNSADVNQSCLTKAFVQDNGKVIMLTIEVATRTITMASLLSPGYAMGDLLRAWGTPTGYSQFGQNIDIYWGARSVHLATCTFYPNSIVDQTTYYSAAPYTAPWKGFIRAAGSSC